MDPTLDSCCAKDEKEAREVAEIRRVLGGEAEKRGLGFAPHRSARTGVALAASTPTPAAQWLPRFDGPADATAGGDGGDGNGSDYDSDDRFLDELDDEDELAEIREARIAQLKCAGAAAREPPPTRRRPPATAAHVSLTCPPPPAAGRRRCSRTAPWRGASGGLDACRTSRTLRSCRWP